MNSSSHRAALILLVLSLVLPPPLITASLLDRYPLTLRDALGRTVTIPRPPRRIISVAPSVTEILFALSVEDRVVGVSDADDYPPQGVRRKARVGGVVLNVERILDLRPDLVVGVAGLQRAQLERLIRLGLPVLAVDAHSLEDTFTQIVLLGRVAGEPAAAGRLAAELRGRTASVEQRVRQRVPPRVYIEIWDEPPQTAAAGTFIDDLVRRAGGRNLFSDLRGWPPVDPEVAVRRNPEVILLTYPGRRRVQGRPGWMSVGAVRRGRIFELDPDLVSRPGPRLVDGLERIARLLHPEAFSPP